MLLSMFFNNMDVNFFFEIKVLIFFGAYNIFQKKNKEKFYYILKLHKTAEDYIQIYSLHELIFLLRSRFPRGEFHDRIVEVGGQKKYREREREKRIESQEIFLILILFYNNHYFIEGPAGKRYCKSINNKKAL